MSKPQRPMSRNDMELGKSKEIDQYPEEVNELDSNKEPISTPLGPMPSKDMELGRSKEIGQYPQEVIELEPDKEPLRINIADMSQINSSDETVVFIEMGDETVVQGSNDTSPRASMIAKAHLGVDEPWRMNIADMPQINSSDEPVVQGSHDTRPRAPRVRRAVLGVDEPWRKPLGLGTSKEINSTGEIGSNRGGVNQEWYNYMVERSIQHGHTRAPEARTIHRVHPNIRKLNEDAYAPWVVSIGPYHHGNLQLEAMEGIKSKRLITQNSNLGSDIFETLDSIEEEARSCYSENIILAPNDFVGMMTMDGFFIVDLLLEASSPSTTHEILNGPPWMLNYIAHDMLLLENQVPFFVLQHIFDILISKRTTKLSLSELAINFFHRLIPTEKKILPKESKPTFHLLDLIHSYLLPTHAWLEQSQVLTRPNRKSKPKYRSKRLDEGFLLPKFSFCCPLSSSDSDKVPPPRQQPVFIPSATKLKEAGVKFKKNGGAESMLEIRFNHGVMEIPPFFLGDYSEFLYRNLIAFEQHCLDLKSYYFTTYAVFMDCIINTANDVDILQQNEILQHVLGNDEDVAHMFNNLCKGVTVYQQNYLADATVGILAHCSLKRNQWRASLVHDYFYNPWAILSLIAAFVIFALTFIQTYFSVISYHA